MKNTKKQPEKWNCIKSEYSSDLKIFKVRFDWFVNPRNNKKLKRVVLESIDWVNIIAITRDAKVVIVQQHRSGTGRITTEIPGGMLDPGESSLEAAKRELREETGYTSKEWKYLGSVEPNPAFHNNLCHHWLAMNVEKTRETELDDGEDIVVSCMSEKELRNEIEKGDLRHSLALSALSRIFDFRDVNFTLMP